MCTFFVVLHDGWCFFLIKFYDVKNKVWLHKSQNLHSRLPKQCFFLYYRAQHLPNINWRSHWNYVSNLSFQLHVLIFYICTVPYMYILGPPIHKFVDTSNIGRGMKEVEITKKMRLRFKWAPECQIFLWWSIICISLQALVGRKLHHFTIRNC